MRSAVTWQSIAAAFVLSLLAVMGAGRADSATLESLLMPGKVISGHAKIEEDCGQCHDRANPQRQTQLCQACHKDIAADVRDRRGFHGRIPGAATIACRACHSDHLGRDASIVTLGAAGFDHSRTDFALDGQHAAAPCAGCHVAGRKYRDAPSGCADCHGKAQPHEGRLGKDCASCHVTAGWTKVAYDHSRTKFPLRDAHATVACAGCHVANRWKDTPTQCVSCHAVDDVHRTQRGIRCGDCHTTQRWDDQRFDHRKQSGFALEGAHARADCQSCHRSGRQTDPLPRDCAGCHGAGDAHAGRLGSGCANCHDATAWKPPRFDHAKDAKFALEGAHSRLGCHACHTAPVATQKLGTTCQGCHRADDVHKAQLGQDCAGCHGTDAWKQDVRFDHDLSRFPLLGMHAVVPCGRCHQSLDFKVADTGCSACHARDDVHRGSFGKACADCHDSNDWKSWRFDHRKATGFALDGAHKPLGCADCHRRPATEVKLSGDCASCHVKDDVHLGQFGRQCARCHTTTTFRRPRVRGSP